MDANASMLGFSGTISSGWLDFSRIESAWFISESDMMCVWLIVNLVFCFL